MTHEVMVAPEVVRSLEGNGDRQSRQALVRRIDALANGPEKEGVGLMGELAGYRCARAGARHVVVFRVQKRKVMVVLAAELAGQEASEQELLPLARRLFRLRLL